MSITKVLDRIRKLLSLSEHTTSEAEAAQAAAKASALMEEYQLSEALVRLDEPSAKPEPIIKDRLEPDAPAAGHKRIAWKEVISSAVAQDLGVELFHWNTRVNGRMCSDVRGMGRESAIQAWRYTCAYLWNAVNALADQADTGGGRAWKNAFRVGCASRIAVRILEKRSDLDTARDAAKKAALGNDDRTALAMTVIEKDRDGVRAAYKELSKGWGTTKSIGQVTSRSGYDAGKAAGDSVSLGTSRAGLAAGQGRLKE